MKYNGKEYYSQGDVYAAIEKENKKLKENIKRYGKEEDSLRKEISSYINKNHILYRNCEDLNNENKFLREENKKLKERIDVLYEFIERNDKLVDEVIDEGDLDKLNEYVYIDDDLVDRTLESED